MSNSYKEIAAANAKAIFDELNFSSDEYARMVAIQSEELTSLHEKIMLLEEDVRLKKIEIKKLKEENSTLKNLVEVK